MCNCRASSLYESVRVAADVQVRRVLQRQNFNGALISILDALLKLRQVCGGSHLLKGNKSDLTMEHAKPELLADILPALVEEGRRVQVFSQFTELLDLVAEQLLILALPFLSLSSKTPTKERGSVVQWIQAQELPVLLLSLKAGGIGLNLTAAATVIHMALCGTLLCKNRRPLAPIASAKTSRCLSTSWWCKAASRNACWNFRRANWHSPTACSGTMPLVYSSLTKQIWRLCWLRWVFLPPRRKRQKKGRGAGGAPVVGTDAYTSRHRHVPNQLVHKMPLLIIDALNIIRRIHEAVPGDDSEAKVADTVTSSLASFKRALKTHRPMLDSPAMGSKSLTLTT